jgi:peptide/nickel transport system substrate-binding protein
MNNSRYLVPLMAFLAILLLSACSAAASPTPVSSPTQVQATPAPSQTPTPAPQKTLTICLGDEPASLYMYANLGASARSVLSAIYDGPIDSNSYAYQPVILKDLPSLENGDALLETVMVREGDRVVDSDGLAVTLTAGMSVLPSGCTSDDCAVTYDGFTDIQMDQMVVTFTLLPGLTWSDGESLTADDSVFSFELASSPETPGSKYLVDRTLSYEAIDDLTVQWWGRPGFIDPAYFTNFWTPAPRHAWKDYAVAELPTLDVSAKSPLGWGPYVMDQWLPGESIHLVKNTRYFRAKEGLPAFDELTFRFISDPNLAISLLIAGTCDVLDPGIPLDDQVELLKAFDTNGQLKVNFSTSLNLEQLAFGIQPASYDESFSIAQGDRPDLFADKRTRQAFAMCLDRQKVVDEVLYGLSEVPSSFIPSEHPQYDPNVTVYSHDAQAGNRLLDEVGWKDQDNDPLTPRQAVGIPGVLDGTPLKMGYLTTGALQRRQVSQLLVGSLAECGVQVDIQYMDPVDMYRIGSGEPLFGRTFDLAEYALAGTGLEPPCSWYLASEIPSEENNWMGINFSGYQDPLFDLSCRTARSSLEVEAPYSAVQETFSEDLPVIPLYWQVKVAASRVGLCGFLPDPTAASSLWNIEGYRTSINCPGE